VRERIRRPRAFPGSGRAGACGEAGGAARFARGQPQRQVAPGPEHPAAAHGAERDIRRSELGHRSRENRIPDSGPIACAGRWRGHGAGAAGGYRSPAPELGRRKRSGAWAGARSPQPERGRQRTSRSGKKRVGGGTGPAWGAGSGRDSGLARVAVAAGVQDSRGAHRGADPPARDSDCAGGGAADSGGRTGRHVPVEAGAAAAGGGAAQGGIRKRGAREPLQLPQPVGLRRHPAAERTGSHSGNQRACPGDVRLLPRRDAGAACRGVAQRGGAVGIRGAVEADASAIGIAVRDATRAERRDGFPGRNQRAPDRGGRQDLLPVDRARHHGARPGAQATGGRQPAVRGAEWQQPGDCEGRDGAGSFRQRVPDRRGDGRIQDRRNRPGGREREVAAPGGMCRGKQQLRAADRTCGRSKPGG
jgi:hypothetical protein